MPHLVNTKIRSIYAIAFIVAAFLVVFSFRWQVVEASRFQFLADARIAEEEIPSLRGTIYAADGSTLAYSEPRYNLFIWVPELIFRESKGLQVREEYLRKMATHLDIGTERLAQLIQELSAKGVGWIQVAENISVETRHKLQAELEGFQGHFFILTSQRVYPEGQLASQIVGLTNTKEDGETVGLGGLEGAWNGNLEPLKGFISGEKDAAGNAVGLASEKTIEAQRGSAIYTSIDKKLQEIVEGELKEAVERYTAASGTVVIMDPKTGEIIALANYPTYDPNTREVTDPSAFGNKAVSEPYEVGSIGKVFTLAAAIDAGVVTPDSVLLSEGHQGCEEITEELEPVCTHDKEPQPPMPIKEAFALSDNLYFYHLSKKMYEQDDQLFYKYLDKFGIGKASGVDAAGESYGYLKSWEFWNIADISAYSYGHSYQANAIQATSGIAAVANYGVRMQPHLVTKVVEADSRVINFDPIALEQVIDKNTTLLMDEMMHVIYLNNIWWWEHHYDDLRDYKIAMKSGTALIPYRDRAGYSNEINATYVGYDASPDRTFVMLTRLERPQGGGLASYNSRLLWLDTFQAFKDYLGVRRIGEF